MRSARHWDREAGPMRIVPVKPEKNVRPDTMPGAAFAVPDHRTARSQRVGTPGHGPAPAPYSGVPPPASGRDLLDALAGDPPHLAPERAGGAAAREPTHRRGWYTAPSGDRDPSPK